MHTFAKILGLKHEDIVYVKYYNIITRYVFVIKEWRLFIYLLRRKATFSEIKIIGKGVRIGKLNIPFLILIQHPIKQRPYLKITFDFYIFSNWKYASLIAG